MESGYKSAISSTVNSTANEIIVDALPAVTSNGLLVLGRGTSNTEIITYSAVDAGASKLTGVIRGLSFSGNSLSTASLQKTHPTGTEIACASTHYNYNMLKEVVGDFYTEVNKKAVAIVCYDITTSLQVSNGLAKFIVPSKYNNHDITRVFAAFETPGSGGATTDVQLRRRRKTASIGASDTQFDITNTAGNTHRYTYDTTGTTPAIADSDASLRVGDIMIIAAQDFAAGNNGRFTITAVASNYFEISNAAGVAENDKTIGTGSIAPIKFRDMLSTKLTIDSGEEDSSSAAAAFAMNTSYDDLLTNDSIYVDLDQVDSSNAGEGFVVVFEVTKQT
jgi:YD repeat-containing protein